LTSLAHPPASSTGRLTGSGHCPYSIIRHLVGRPVLTQSMAVCGDLA